MAVIEKRISHKVIRRRPIKPREGKEKDFNTEEGLKRLLVKHG